MAGELINVYIDGELLCNCYSSEIYFVTSTGLIIKHGTGDVTVAEWTYSGSNQFLGFSKTQGATTAEYGIGSSTQLVFINPTGHIYLYSVEVANPTVTYYKTTSTDLTSVADAIRAKGGTVASLVYPTGFVSAIDNLTADESEVTITLHGETIANDRYRLYFTASDVAKIINAWIVKVEIVSPATNVFVDSSLYTFYVSSKNDSPNSLCYFYMAGTNNKYFTFNPKTGVMVKFCGDDLIYDSENNYYYWVKFNGSSN